MPVQQLTRELAETVVADHMREEFFGELRLQGGVGYEQYSDLRMRSFGEETAHYEGFAVMPCYRTLDAESAAQLNVPTNRKLWLARAMVVEMPSRIMGETRGRATWSNYGASGYFWATGHGAWATDRRSIADPELLGDMAQECNRRTRLIINIQQAGARAVRSHVENLDDMFVRVTSVAGVTHEAIFDAGSIVDIFNRYRYGHKLSSGVAGHRPLPDVLEALVVEDYPES